MSSQGAEALQKSGEALEEKIPPTKGHMALHVGQASGKWPKGIATSHLDGSTLILHWSSNWHHIGGTVCL